MKGLRTGGKGDGGSPLEERGERGERADLTGADAPLPEPDRRVLREPATGAASPSSSTRGGPVPLPHFEPPDLPPGEPGGSGSRLRSLWDSATRDWGLKLFSLVVALLLWAWRSSQINPDEFRTYSELQVRIVNLREDLVVVNYPLRVDVELHGPRRTLDRLARNEELEPVIDCAAIKEPTWRQMPVQIDHPNTVQVVRIEPPELELDIDRLVEVTKTIAVNTGSSSPPDGFFNEAPQLARTEAVLRGPRKLVSRVAAAEARIDLDGRTAPFEIQARLRPVDNTGQEVLGVDLTPRGVTVKVPIKRVEGTREMRVEVPTLGQPAEGYRLLDTVVTPPRVTVRGTTVGLAQLDAGGGTGGGTGAIQTEAVDVAGVDARFTTRVPVRTPPGVVARPREVEVRVEVGRAKLAPDRAAAD